MKELKITVETHGDEKWPRFVLQDNFARWWTGDAGWSDQSSEALLFGDETAAQESVDELNRLARMRLFKARVEILVDCEEEFSLDQLRQFLIENCKAWIGNDGSQPALEKATIQALTFWDELEEYEKHE